jgi:hypothetical protein
VRGHVYAPNALPPGKSSIQELEWAQGWFERCGLKILQRDTPLKNVAFITDKFLEKKYQYHTTQNIF